MENKIIFNKCGVSALLLAGSMAVSSLGFAGERQSLIDFLDLKGPLSQSEVRAQNLAKYCTEKVPIGDIKVTNEDLIKRIGECGEYWANKFDDPNFKDSSLTGITVGITSSNFYGRVNPVGDYIEYELNNKLDENGNFPMFDGISINYDLDGNCNYVHVPKEFTKNTRIFFYDPKESNDYSLKEEAERVCTRVSNEVLTALNSKIEGIEK